MKKVFLTMTFLVFSVLVCFGQSVTHIPVLEEQDENAKNTLLIITEDSEFKGRIIEQLLPFIDENNIAAKIIISPDFSEIDHADYDVVLMIWHVENSILPEPAAEYINSLKDKSRYVLLASHGNGNLNADYKVDTVTGASEFADPVKKAGEIIELLTEKFGF